MKWLKITNVIDLTLVPVALIKSNMADVGKLSEEASRRKERLLAMKNRTKTSGEDPPAKKLAQGEMLPK